MVEGSRRAGVRRSLLQECLDAFLVVSRLKRRDLRFRFRLQE